MEVGGLEISRDLLEMPLSVFIQNLPPHYEKIDEVPTLALKTTLFDASPTLKDATSDDVSLADQVPCPKRVEPWTTLRGLTSLGNACFMNSALQSLAATPLLRKYFHQGEYQFDQTTSRPPPHKHLLSLKRETPPPSLTQVFSQLLHEMKSVSPAAEKGPANAVTPIKMYSALGALFPHMCDGTQQDAQEFISSFVSKLNEELKREPALSHEPEESVLSPQSRTILSRISTGQDAFPGSPSSGISRHDSHELQKISPRDSDGRHDRIVAMEWWVSHLINEPSVITCFFSGQFKSVLTCSACGKKSTRFEPFSSLQLPIANRERKAANSLDVTVVVHFADSPRFRRPRRFVIPAINDWAVQDLLLKIAQDHFTTSEQQPQPVLVAAVVHGSLIQDVYDEDMLLVAVPMPIHVLELDSSVVNSVPTISMGADPYGSVLTTRSDPAPGDDVLVRMSTDRLVKGVITTAHTHVRTTPRSYDVLLTEGMTNGRTVHHTSDVVTKSAAMGRAVYLRCIHRHSVLAPFYCTTPQHQVVSDSPFMIRMAAGSLTGSVLYNIVARRFFGRSAIGNPRRSSRESAAPGWRFVLRRVCDDGKNCGRCHWMHNCSGCLVDDRGTELLALEMDETIAIDWDDGNADASHGNDRSAVSAAPYEPVLVEDDESYRSYRAQRSQSIADSLAMLCSEETLEARCSACQQQQQQQQRAPYTLHTKQLLIWSVPPVLVLQLKRFELAVGAQGDYTWQKLSDRVDFPVRGLRLSAFLSEVDGSHSDEAACSRRCTEILDERVLRGMAYLQDELGLPLDSASRSCTTYDLYAVINHTGELNSGHYTAVVRHPEDAESDDWWLADDATVTRADLSLFASSATAYVLFFVRRDIATSASDLVNASIGLDGARGDRFRRPREFFPRRPNSDGLSGPALSQPPLLPQKRHHHHHQHQRKEKDATPGSDDARTRSGRARAAANGDNPMCAVM